MKGGNNVKTKKPREDDLSFVCYILKENGEVVPLESLTEAEREQFRRNMARRLSRGMNEYYRQHPDEYAKL